MKTLKQFVRQHIFLDMNKVIEQLFKHELIGDDDIFNFRPDDDKQMIPDEWLSVTYKMSQWLIERDQLVIQYCNRFFWGRIIENESFEDDAVILDIYNHVMGEKQ